MVHTIRNRVLCLLASAARHQAEQSDGHLLHRFVAGKEQQMLLVELDKLAKELGFEGSVVTFR
jgi:hypothetical protein